MKILLVEDDDSIVSLLTRTLTAQHYIVDAVKDGEMGWNYASTFDYDSIVLDIMLPKLDGITLCKRLRGEGYTMPIVMLTGQDLITAKVQSLDAGADDYIVKPFDINELMARMRALLRRSSNNPLPLLSWGDLMLDPSTCEVTYDGRLLSLTTKEYDLLELFLRDSYHVFSSDEIIDRLWSSDDFPAEATVRSHLRRLRQKLHAAGAPIDAISTIHGRGYYLKSTQTNGNISSAPTLSSAVNRENPALQIDRQQQQYRSFLQETWVTTKCQCLESVSEIQATVDRLLLGECSYPQQELAHRLAHKLVGTLGVFGLMSGMEIARQMEILLDRPTLLMPTELIILPALLEELATEIEYGETIQSNPNSSADRSFLLFVDLDPSLSFSLAELATNQNIQTMTVANIDAAYGYISTIPDAPIDILTSTVLFVRLASDRDRAPLLGFIANLHQRFSHWSVVVLSERDNLPDRLAVANNGGKFIATAGLTTEQIFTAATSFLQPATTIVKIMVVDDDLDWLRALPQLLQPWGLKTTTLADPQQFLAVLQAVQPEALVLDLNMPDINGLELCQVLRSDPQWQYLPILFVSATNDSIAQQQAFEVGADDYLCKPIMGGELARRIRHRLARGQCR